MSDVKTNINFDGDKNLMVYKFPFTRFNSMSVITVEKNTEAVLFLNGKALDLLTEGEYSLETKNIPLFAELTGRGEGDMTGFDCGICFVNKETQLKIEWISPSGKKGFSTVKVSDSKKLISKLLMFTDLEKESVEDYLNGFAKENADDNLEKAFEDIGLSSDNKVTFVPEFKEVKKTSEPEIKEETEQAPTFVPKTKKTPKPKKKMSKGMKAFIIIAIVVAAVAIAAIIIYPFFKEDEPKYIREGDKYVNTETGEVIESQDGYYIDENGELIVPNEKDMGLTELKNAQVGDFVYFGTYEQDNNKKSKEKICWKVLAKDGNKLTLITQYGIDAKPFNSTDIEIDWRNSSVRKWLQGEFYKNAFSAKEKEMIVTTVNKNALDTNYNLENGDNTEDKVFLLSIDEAKSYMAGAEAFRKANATDYAKANGVYVEDTGKGCRWWLRSPGDTKNTAAVVEADGYVAVFGDGVTNEKVAVRPVINIDISK